MRTDSTHLSGDALNMARGYIQKTFGDKYLPEKPNFFSSSNKSAQEAHEAIRPTSALRTPAHVARFLSDDERKLYDLVWKRAVASQMIPATLNTAKPPSTTAGTRPSSFAIVPA